MFTMKEQEGCQLKTGSEKSQTAIRMELFSCEMASAQSLVWPLMESQDCGLVSYSLDWNSSPSPPQIRCLMIKVYTMAMIPKAEQRFVGIQETTTIYFINSEFLPVLHTPLAPTRGISSFLLSQ